MLYLLIFRNNHLKINNKTFTTTAQQVRNKIKIVAYND